MKVAGLLVLAGWVLLAVSAWVVYPPAGLTVAGVACLRIAKDAA